MSEPGDSENIEDRAAKLLLSFVCDLREREVTDEDMELAFGDLGPLPPEFEAIANRRIGAAEARKLLRQRSYSDEEPLSWEELCRRLKDRKVEKSGEQGGRQSSHVFRILGLPEILAKSELGLAADERRPPRKKFQFQVLGGEAVVDAHIENNWEYLALSVWDRSGEPTLLLNGAEILDIERNRLATVDGSSARILARAIENGLIIRTASGDLLEPC